MKTIMLTGFVLALTSGIAFAQAPAPTRMGGALPDGASAGTYLGIAGQAVAAHQKTRARVALGRAETDLLTNSYVEGSVQGMIRTPAIDAVRRARSAVERGDYARARMLVHRAITMISGGAAMGAPMPAQGSGSMMPAQGANGMPVHGSAPMMPAPAPAAK
ncbi:MAG TPA: hypothetical protein PLV07_07820 [Acidiphilium sp.]|jgi:hypothetical protein|uniref:hypothetical protein n=1 Tax=unclassified Acidiphilium TaxID=2617493 RepID=UPI000BDA5ED0|nr:MULTISPECIES: hypothetical protein [unclassified Acidiphilium]OYV57432.1 MAG: hypothetical protein B7Z76_01265 [Acidiphilium sp. 20-67-58]OYV84441.1 MAG: hypothetical protein B7Z64_07745 [Acidiphilium sp. 21-68-69]HQT59703.1 hypothetical protein [Acidiphilium sp.]HQU11477.1 hypothetical protein [Acidiphilium sp.]